MSAERGVSGSITGAAAQPGFHDLDSGSVYGLDGTRLQAGSGTAVFEEKASLDLDQYKTAFPHRLAVKHAHSQVNIEARWGQYVLLSIQFALFCLNDYFAAQGLSFSRPGTKVIAAGVANGGGAALRAAEEDTGNPPLIDGVVVSEPQIQPLFRKFDIAYDDRVLSHHSRSFLDTVTLMDVYAPAAAFCLDPADPTDAQQQRRVQRCAELKKRGLLNAHDTVTQSREALDIIQRHGLLREANFLLRWHESLGFWRLLSAVFANTYGRACLTDHLCGVSFAPIDRGGMPVAMSEVARAQLSGWGNGLSYFIGPDDLSDVVDDRAGRVASLNAALCFRSLVTGALYPEQNPVEARWIDTARMQAGAAKVKATAHLRGKPALILHGRSDALIPPNHSSRPYYGSNKLLEGKAGKLSYIEIANGNHFDFFIPTFGAKALVPMHYYLEQALTLMRKHLLDGDPLPDSQVVPASGDHKPWAPGNLGGDLPNIAAVAAADNRITFDGSTLTVPIGKKQP